MAAFTLHDLEKRVQDRAQAAPGPSYTRTLIDKGVAHCAKKLGEEAVEVAIAAIAEDRGRVVAEAADLLYTCSSSSTRAASRLTRSKRPWRNARGKPSGREGRP